MIGEEGQRDGVDDRDPGALGLLGLPGGEQDKGTTNAVWDGAVGIVAVEGRRASIPVVSAVAIAPK